MKRSYSSLALLIALSLLSVPAMSQETIWFTPLGGMNSSSSNLTIAPGQPPQSIRITSSATGGTYFVNLGLTLPSTVTIDAITVCYQLASVANYISQTRVTRMLTPDVATIILDDGTDHNLVTLECYEVDTNIPVNAVMTLSLRVEFTNTTDWIEIGAIGIRTSAVAGMSDSPATPQVGAALLAQNHPNPFNPSTLIAYEVAREGKTELRIFNVQGELVRTLVDRQSTPGTYEVEWDGRDDNGQSVPSGSYYYRLAVDGNEDAKRMILIK
jgi:hypothetical protein